ncbi:MAG: DNA repair protein RadA [Peptococcaceae bacterium]
MAVKNKVKFFCQECGYESLKWLGRCPGCNTWNSFVEEISPTVKGKGSLITNPDHKPVRLAQIAADENERIDTGIPEFNRVLGGGLVPGALILLAGDPGIGKSTLTLQTVDRIKVNSPVLYVTGEESAGQVKLRAQRLNVKNDNLLILAETNLELIEAEVLRAEPALVVLDSIQTVYLTEISSAPGSVSQLRECAARVMQWAKTKNIPVIIVGHVTKDGAVAGPRVLEHMVDAVLYFEGERHYQYRVLRGLKNRFGSTNELGIFEMQENGLIEVNNPSEAFLSERPQDSSGSIVVPCMEGTRPLLIELQALVSPSIFGQPRRITTGTDFNRVALIMAVLDKRLGLNLGTYDAYINIVGGLKIDEPAIDLAIAAAIASSYKNVVAEKRMVVFGEIGLTGEVRAVNHLEKRLSEARKLGFTKGIIPLGNTKNKDVFPIEIIGVKTVSEALEIILGG